MSRKTTTKAQALAVAKEMVRYENKWVAVVKNGNRETVIASGDRVIDAKAAVDKQKSMKNITYRKIPSSKKVFIAAICCK